MTMTARPILAAFLLLLANCFVASGASFSVPTYLVPPIGEGYLLSKSDEFSSRYGSINEIFASESLKVFVWSTSLDSADMKKSTYKIKFSSGEKYEGDLENLGNGYFAVSLDFDGESGPLGGATLSVELADESRNKLKLDDIAFTRVEEVIANKAAEEAEASHDGFVTSTNAPTTSEPSALPTTSEPSATPTTSAPTLSKSPTSSPTTSPTDVPSASPTGPCVPCSNDPSGAMATKNRTCESFRLTKSKCADATYAWRRDKTCKFSCFTYGHPYDEDRCCTDLPEVEEVAPVVETSNATKTNITGINRFNGETEAEGESRSMVRNDDTEYEERMKKHYNNTPCFDEYDCLSDRLSQNQKLFSGEGICSRDGRLMFGLDHDGSLQWKNCTAGGKYKTYYKDGASTDSFVMTETADFVIYDESEGVKWELPCDVEVDRHAQCYTVPSGSITYDCPYLHLHRGGNVALNYIDGKDWIAASIGKFYTFRGQ